MTDHSPRLTVAHGLTTERLRQQLDEIAGLNDELAPFRILTGIEVDILADGALDQTDELLAALDVVVASAHSKLRMEPPEMTARLVAAVESPHTDVLGHCTGRLIVGRGLRLLRPQQPRRPRLVPARLVRSARRRPGRPHAGDGAGPLRRARRSVRVDGRAALRHRALARAGGPGRSRRVGRRALAATFSEAGGGAPSSGAQPEPPENELTAVPGERAGQYDSALMQKPGKKRRRKLST
jgi:hypothetical protein